MKIYRAIKNNILTQGFGRKNTRPSMISLYESIGMVGHNGWDWLVKCRDNAVKRGGQCENIYCDLSGQCRITAICQDEKLGLGITAISEDKDGIFQHRWWHLDGINPKLKVGDTLESGDYLGIAGNTGLSTGAHLHRDLKIMGKDTYGNYYKKEPNNGYFGGIDPEPYFTNIFILDIKDNLTKQISLLGQMVNALKKLLEILKNK